MPEQLRFEVPPRFDGALAKHFLRNHCKLSARMITRLKQEKDGIMMNGKILRTVDKVESGAEVIITLPEEASEYIEPVAGELSILYEDSYLLIIDKQPYMPVHPVKQHQTDTLANIVASYMKDRGERYVFRCHNRLDRNTSGIVVIAKDKFTINLLKNNTEKTYIALVHGELSGSGTIDEPIGLMNGSKIVRQVSPDGSRAVTHYTSLFSSPECSVVRLRLETGKTHQIRCHMSYIGHPLLGDDLYGGRTDIIPRHALHCRKIKFAHPVTNEAMIIKSAVPEDMLEAMNRYNIKNIDD